MHNLILVINPGSTSTKLAIFDNEQCLKETTLRHAPAELSKFTKVSDQLAYRKALITDFMRANHYEFKQLKCIAARGGLLRPIKSGTYLVNDKMVVDLNSTIYGEHASNLGAIIAYAYTQEYGMPSYVADPVVVDEL
ncbi:hypothetical protein FACS1894166_09170 [Bacilli bacterium]|nr:hypothetical protein FACS1894166_09170 [Bacilli bacterium]